MLLSLTALEVGTRKSSLTSLRTSETNSFRDIFNYEVDFIASFILTYFSSTTFFKVFVCVSNLNSSTSLLKSESIAKVYDQKLHHT